MRNLNPKREKDESFPTYKERRSSNHEFLKWYLKGSVFWPSYTYGQYKIGDERAKNLHRK